MIYANNISYFFFVFVIERLNVKETGRTHGASISITFNIPEFSV